MKNKDQKLTRRSLLILFIMTLMSYSYGQIVVSGRVTNASDGTVLPGVNVLIKGTSTGTISDLDGNYKIEASNEDATLVFSYIGFLTEEVTVANQTTIDMSLIEDITALEQIIVIGYGTRKKDDITGAVATVSDNYLEQQPGGDVASALQGSVAGVHVTQSNTPGGTAKIEIRGMGTINNNDPLWVVDGIYGAQAPPASQIESIQILKDAASTAIYGSAGANGVILVTTKSGRKKSPLQVDLNVRAGFVAPNAKYDILTDPTEIGELILLEQNNSNPNRDPSNPHYDWSSETPVLYDYLWPNGGVLGEVDESTYDEETNRITRSNPEGTDWLDEIYQNGLTQDYNLAITGGSEKSTYGVHLSYYDEAGQLILSSYDKIGIRTNLDMDVKKWLRVGQRLSFTQSNSHGFGGGNSGEGLLHHVVELNPILPTHDIEDNLAGNAVGRVGGIATPLAQLERSADNLYTNNNILGNFYLELKPLKGLTFKSLYGYDLRDGKGKYPRYKAPEHTAGREETGLAENSFKYNKWNWTNTLNYATSFGNHAIDLLLGAEAIEEKFSNLDGEITGFFSEDPHYMVLDAGASNPLIRGNITESSKFSLFGRIHYGFQNKYLVDVILRRDGSSKLGEGERYGLFPSVSLAWKLSEESFMSGTENWLTLLKVRGSWGQSGNDRIANYNSFTSFEGRPYSSFYAIDGSDNNLSQGFHSTTFGENVVWETTTSSNIGLDATLIKSLGLSLDLWTRTTTDMLYGKQIPQVTGHAQAPSVNIGEMENKGIDIVIDYKGDVLNKELRYFVSANFSLYRNKVIKLNNEADEYIQGGTIRGQVYTRTEAGRSFPEYYGYVVDGIFQDSTEAANWTPFGNYNEPGNLRFVNTNGDTIISDEDRQYIGNPHPDWTAGLNLGLEYKGIDLSATFYACVGHDLINYNRRFTDFGMYDGPGSPNRLYESWGSPYLNENNQAATLPKALPETSEEQRASNIYVEDGSFLRLQNIQLGYSLPQQWIDKVQIKKVRIYVMATNLFTITNYTGINPEVVNTYTTGNTQMNRGVDVSNFPALRTYMFGLNLSF